MAKISEKGIAIFLSIILIFLFTAFDQTVGTLYLILVSLNLIFQLLEKSIDISLEESEEGRLEDLAIAVVAFFIFLVIIQQLNRISGQSAIGLQSSLQLLSTTVPLLKANKLTQLLTFGFVIATIETLLIFGRILEIVVEEFIPGVIGRKIRYDDLSDGGTWLAYITVSAIFTIIHIQTRVGKDIPLAITFIFGIIECVLVAVSKNLRSATLLHIINNTLAVMIALKLITLSVVN